MGADSIKLVRARGIWSWLRVYLLYLEAFPAYERKPFSIILRMEKKGSSDVWCCLLGHRIAGFATTINSDKMILLDYLAVRKGFRGRGYGSNILSELSLRYHGKGMFVEIESEYEDVPNREERHKRKQFYISCDYTPMNVMAIVFGTKMELLGKGCCIDFNEYHTFYRENYAERAAHNIVWAQHPESKQ